jgi:hypothetical protein
MFGTLLDDLCIIVIQFLPLKDVFSVSYVCKEWHALVNDERNYRIRCLNLNSNLKIESGGSEPLFLLLID